MGRVPPVHFQVELAEPTVLHEACFLRRHRARALDGRQILREHDPPFQFLPARVLAFREVHGAAAEPEFRPGVGRRLPDRGKGRQVGLDKVLRGEGQRKLDRRAAACEDLTTIGLTIERGPLGPGQRRVILRGLQRSLQVATFFAWRDGCGFPGSTSASAAPTRPSLTSGDSIRTATRLRPGWATVSTRTG